MNYGEGGLSASDVALIQGGGRNGGDGLFGEGNGAWFIILFLIFAIFGWGGNRGFGGYGGGDSGSNGGSGAFDNYVLASDFSQLSRQLSDGFNSQERKLDSITNGLCDGFYTQAQLINTTNANIANAQYNLANAITSNGYETRIGINGIGNQLANCCCDIRQQISDCCCKVERGIDGVNYNMAMNLNSLQNTLCNNTRDIIESQNANYRALHDEIVANRIEDKNAQIQALQTKLNNAELRASQEAQSAYLLNELKPCPSAAYIVPNPNCCYDYTVSRNSCGCNNGCGC